MHDVPTKEKAFGNVSVIEMLERWLAAARLGSINYVALAGCIPPTTVITEFAGSIQMEEVVPGALRTLMAEVEKSIAKRKPPDPPDPDLTADYYCYNVATWSLGFDFIPALISAEMERIRAGAPAPLKIHFWRGDSGKLGLETEYRQKTFEGIVRPSLALIGAVEDERALRGRQTTYFYSDIVNRARAGESIPKLRPTAKASAFVRSLFLHDEQPITITLRETDIYPHRNSNLDAWCNFARYLRKRGECVVMVRDTAKADRPLAGLMTCPEASRDLGIRMALYEHAKCNLFVSNGPGSLGWFGSKPWLQFIKVNDGSLVFFETSSWWQEAANMEVGGQLPWCRPDQRIVWESDTYDNICKAWSELWLTIPR